MNSKEDRDLELQRLSALEANRWMQERSYAYLDVRTVAEFDEGHPAGAYNIPWQVPGPQGLEPNLAFVAEVRAHFPLDTKLVLGCRSGRRSLAAGSALLEAGFTQLAEQRGGFQGARDPFGEKLEPGWAEESLPCATRARPGRDYASLTNPR